VIINGSVLNKDFPSLELGYEQVKDVLQEQAELHVIMPIELLPYFSIAIAVLGIAFPYC